MEGLKKSVLSLLKSHILYEQLEKCEYKLRESNDFAYDGWNTTIKYLDIMCSNINDLKKIESQQKDLKSILYDKIGLGMNDRDAEYKLGISVKLAIKNKNKLEYEVSFEKIEKNILASLEEAKYFIWGAISWITNEKIVSLLNKKAEEGLNIQIIRNDDFINNNNDFFKRNKNMQVFKFSPKGYCKNIMHNKFCIIDGKKVITGSYNWTKKAEYNSENINIISNSSLGENEEVLTYMDEFIKIKRKCDCFN